MLVGSVNVNPPPGVPPPALLVPAPGGGGIMKPENAPVEVAGAGCCLVWPYRIVGWFCCWLCWMGGLKPPPKGDCAGFNGGVFQRLLAWVFVFEVVEGKLGLAAAADQSMPSLELVLRALCEWEGWGRRDAVLPKPEPRLRLENALVFVEFEAVE